MKYSDSIFVSFLGSLNIVWLRKGSNAMYTYDLDDWTHFLVKG